MAFKFFYVSTTSTNYADETEGPWRINGALNFFIHAFRWTADEAQSCCDLSAGPHGQEKCWDSSHTFESCCSNSDWNHAETNQNTSHFFWVDNKQYKVYSSRHLLILSDLVREGANGLTCSNLLFPWIWFKTYKYRSTVWLFTFELDTRKLVLQEPSIFAGGRPRPATRLYHSIR